MTVASVWPFALLGVALLIALGFEFVNGFHDTANAVATVIYTHSLDPNIAVVWSGLCNLAGVLVSSGAVAFSVITLLPVELILQVSYGAGFAMVFALLIAAIIWNLSTWWFGLPASSSHTMVGSIIGVGVANQLMSVHSGTSGVDWGQATKVFQVLLISPIVGFVCAGALLLISKFLFSRNGPKRFAVLFDANHKKPLWLIPTIAITGIPGAYVFLYFAPHGFRSFRHSGDGGVEADQIFRGLESADGPDRDDVADGRHRLVPGGRIREDCDRECRCAVYRAEGQRSSTVADSRRC